MKRKLAQVLQHFFIIGAGLLLCLGLPAYACLPAGGGADAVSSASQVAPEQPSGEFLLILNRERHTAVAQWKDFFTEKPVEVIMEDLSCAVAKEDGPGLALAQRFQARLAERQMTLRSEEGTLLVSKAEQGIYDLLILSKEAAEAFDYRAVCARPEALALQIGVTEGLPAETGREHI